MASDSAEEMLGQKLKRRFERQKTARALIASGVSRTDAAKALAISKQTLSRDLANIDQ